MVLSLVPMLMLASCGGYDDTPIKQDLASLEERITALETVRSDIDGIFYWTIDGDEMMSI